MYIKIFKYANIKIFLYFKTHTSKSRREKNLHARSLIANLNFDIIKFLVF